MRKFKKNKNEILSLVKFKNYTFHYGKNFMMRKIDYALLKNLNFLSQKSYKLKILNLSENLVNIGIRHA